MKLSFSTKGWSERSWDELVGLAEEMDFNGIEVFDAAKNEELVGKGAPFHIYNTHATARELREKGLHAATAESCTGGMIAERLTNVPGSSEVFGYGFVTYAEAAKQKLLGVPAGLIERYNVVSGPVAAAMAFGAAKAAGAELAVGITGIAGPGGALPGKPVGTVYLAGADARTNTGHVMRLTLGGYRERSVIRARAAMYALDMLRRMALGLPVPDSLTVTPDTPAETMDM